MHVHANRERNAEIPRFFGLGVEFTEEQAHVDTGGTERLADSGARLFFVFVVGWGIETSSATGLACQHFLKVDLHFERLSFPA